MKKTSEARISFALALVFFLIMLIPVVIFLNGFFNSEDVSRELQTKLGGYIVLAFMFGSILFFPTAIVSIHSFVATRKSVDLAEKKISTRAFILFVISALPLVAVFLIQLFSGP